MAQVEHWNGSAFVTDTVSDSLAPTVLQHTVTLTAEQMRHFADDYIGLLPVVDITHVPVPSYCILKLHATEQFSYAGDPDEYLQMSLPSFMATINILKFSDIAACNGVLLAIFSLMPSLPLTNGTYSSAESFSYGDYAVSIGTNGWDNLTAGDGTLTITIYYSIVDLS